MAKKEDVISTRYPGIKQRRKDGKYIVTLDYGRIRRYDEKTGKYVTRQNKSTRIVDTLKEAKAIQGENNKEKRFAQVTGVTGKVPFDKALSGFMKKHEDEWSLSYLIRQQIHEKRCIAYFADTDVRKIDPLDLEDFYKWCQTGEGKFKPLSTNTIIKVKSFLNEFYCWMIKAPSKYGVFSNPVTMSDCGKKEPFEAQSLETDIVQYTINYCLRNEKDYSVMVLYGLGCLAGMRRGEICGLKWGDIDWKTKRIYVSRQHAQLKGGWIEKVPKRGNDEGKTPGERRERWTALPDCLARLLEFARMQQEAYGGRPITDDDYVYRTKTNVVNSYLPHPGKIDRRFAELQTRVNKIRKAAGLEEIPSYRLHDLRHTHISWCLNNKVTPLQVYASVGHGFTAQNANTTVRVYWHDDGNREDIVECIDKLIRVNENPIDMKDNVGPFREFVTTRKDLRNDEI